MNKHLKQLGVICIILVIVLIIGFSYKLIFHKEKANDKYYQYIEELNFKGDNPAPISLSSSTYNITIDPEVAVIFQTSNGLSYAKHNIKVCNPNILSISSLGNLGLRFNQQVQDLEIVEVKYENTIISQTPEIIEEIIGLYPNGSNIINTLISYRDNYGYAYINYPITPIQTQFNNQYVYYLPISLNGGICKDYIIEYKPSEDDNTLKWDAYIWQGLINAPTNSLLLDPNWILQGSNFQIETYTNYMWNDGQNLSLNGTGSSGTAESVSFCPNGNKQNWSLITWNVPHNYSIADNCDDAHYCLRLNETVGDIIKDDASGVSWTDSLAGSHNYYTSEGCVHDRCVGITNIAGTGQKFVRNTLNDDALENSDISIEFWFNNTQNCGVGDCYVFYYSTDGGGLLGVSVIGGTGITCFVNAVSNTAGFSTTKGWHHGICTFGSITNDIWLDGIKVFNGADTSTITAGGATANYFIMDGNNHGDWFNVDEFILRTGANAYLDDGEIKDSYRRGLAKYDLAVRFGSSNATIVNMPYQNITNTTRKKVEANSSIECVQYKYYGYTLNASSNYDPYLRSINFSYSSISSTSIGNLNATQLRIYTALWTNYTNEDVLVSFIPISTNKTEFNASIIWIKDSKLNISFINMTVTNNTLIIYTLTNENTTKGDNWTAQITLQDDFTKNSINTTQLIILNALPSIPDVIYPPNNTNTFNLSIQMHCNNSIDIIDNDPISYEFWADENNPPATIIQNLTIQHANYSISPTFDYRTHYWRCRANDNASVSSYNTTRAIISDRRLIIYPNEFHKTSVSEGSNQIFEFNTSYNNNLISTINSIFYYNSTLHPVIKTVINETYIKFRTNFNIPTIESSMVKSFSWNLTIFLLNATNIYNNSYIYSQTVLTTNLSICTSAGTNSAIALNYTVRNEENETYLANSSISMNFITYDGDIGINKSYIFGITSNIYNLKICLSPIDIKLDMLGQIQYNHGYYDSRDYYYRNYKVDNITDDTGLYLLESSRASPITFTITDPNGLEIVNAIINVERYNVGNDTMHTIAMGKTNQEGKDLIYLRKNDVFYTVIVIQEDGTTNVFPNQKIISDEVNIQIVSPSYIGTYSTFINTLKNISLHDRTFYAYYNDSSNNVKSGCFKIQRVNLNFSNFIYEECVSASSGSFVYTVDNSSSLFISVLTLQINPNLYGLSLSGDFTGEGLFGILGPGAAILLAILINLAIISIGLWKPEVAIFASVITMIVFFVLKLIPITYGIMLSFVIAAFLLLRKLSKVENN